MTLDLLAVSEDQANQLADQFRLHPEALYENILQTLLGSRPCNTETKHQNSRRNVRRLFFLR